MNAESQEVTMSRTPIAIAAIAAVVAALALAAAALATSQPQTPELNGTWATNISLQNPPPGIDATFQALDTFTAGGGILVSSSQAHPSARSLAHGTCSHDGGLSYSCTFEWFRFDPASGAYLGMQRVERTMTLAVNAQSFEASDTIQVLAPNGTVVATLQGSESGHRLGS